MKYRLRERPTRYEQDESAEWTSHDLIKDGFSFMVRTDRTGHRVYYHLMNVLNNIMSSRMHVKVTRLFVEHKCEFRPFNQIWYVQGRLLRNYLDDWKSQWPLHFNKAACDALIYLLDGNNDDIIQTPVAQVKESSILIDLVSEESAGEEFQIEEPEDKESSEILSPSKGKEEIEEESNNTIENEDEEKSTPKRKRSHLLYNNNYIPPPSIPHWAPCPSGPGGALGAKGAPVMPFEPTNFDVIHAHCKILKAIAALTPHAGDEDLTRTMLRQVFTSLRVLQTFAPMPDDMRQELLDDMVTITEYAQGMGYDRELLTEDVLKRIGQRAAHYYRLAFGGRSPPKVRRIINHEWTQTNKYTAHTSRLAVAPAVKEILKQNNAK